ncbi:glycosyltransferase family 4 protein [Lachnospiraceae bacterium 29-91]
MHIIFFGAGRIGKRMLDLWKQFNIWPDFFLDNSEELWGTFFHGIKVLPIEQLGKMSNIKIFITCNQTEAISAQLLNYGIKEQDIFEGNSVSVNSMIPFWGRYMYGKLHWEEPQNEVKRQKEKDHKCVLIDLQNGFALGGVEEWSYKTAHVLLKKGYIVKYLVTDFFEYEGNKKELVVFKYKSGLSGIEEFKNRLIEIKRQMPCSIICNFHGDTFYLSCLAKLLWPQQVNLVAVIHNDEEAYYERYSQMSMLIDHCLVISSKIKNSILKRGFPETKIRMISWTIPCDANLNRLYSREKAPVRIGYAGRITVIQKRMDLLMKIAEKLNEMEIDFILEIAGTGDYLQEFKNRVDEERLQKKVEFLGRISNEEISTFWKRQDIVVSCSDFEGRSISQAEAMAAGAVPVITDTSGSRDYVQNGYNGYIVPVGAVDDLAEKICFLYRHRELLELMGSRSHEVIMKQNLENNTEMIWDEILK